MNRAISAAVLRSLTDKSLSFVLCVLGIILVGCNSKEYDRLTDEVRQLESEVSDLKSQKTLLYEQRNEASNLIARFSQLQRDESQHLIELDEIDEYERELEATVKYLDDQLSIWLPATQRSLEGLSLGSIRVGEGRMLTDAVVVWLDNLQVEIKHNEGSEVVSLATLDEPIRKRLLHKETVELSSEVQN